MKKIINILGVISIGLIISGCFGSIEAISVVPSIVKFSIIPGESKSDVFNIHNTGNEEVYVEIFMKDWILENNSRKFAKPGTHSRSLSKWVTLEEESVTIAPKQSRKVRYMIEVPKNANGGYWGLVCFESRPVKRGTGGGIKVATQLVSFMGVEAEGTLQKKIKIIEVLAEYVKDKGVRLKAILKNLGNVPLFQPSPLGKYKIKDKDEVIAEGELEGTMILPDETGEYTSSYFKLKNGEYKTIVFFDYGGTKLSGKEVILPIHTFFDWKKLNKVKSKE